MPLLCRLGSWTPTYWGRCRFCQIYFQISHCEYKKEILRKIPLRTRFPQHFVQNFVTRNIPLTFVPIQAHDHTLMCPPWIPWIPCSCGLVSVLPILSHTLVMSSVWSGPSSARVWLIYCLCNLPINGFRTPTVVSTPVRSHASQCATTRPGCHGMQERCSSASVTSTRTALERFHA